MPVSPVPAGYHTITPYLIVNGAAKAIDFYKKALGAVELYRLPTPDGKVGHAEIRVGDSIIMLADEMKEMNYLGPKARGGTSVSLLVYGPNVDAQFKKAIAAGGKVAKPLQDQFYGDRSGTFTDPFGHMWTVATHIEDVSPDEMNRRFEAMMAQHAGDAKPAKKSKKTAKKPAKKVRRRR